MQNVPRHTGQCIKRATTHPSAACWVCEQWWSWRAQKNDDLPTAAAQTQLLKQPFSQHTQLSAPSSHESVWTLSAENKIILASAGNTQKCADNSLKNLLVLAKDHDLSPTGEDLCQGVKFGSKSTPTPLSCLGCLCRVRIWAEWSSWIPPSSEYSGIWCLFYTKASPEPRENYPRPFPWISGYNLKAAFKYRFFTLCS